VQFSPQGENGTVLASSDAVVPVAGLEPARLAALDFESFAPHGTQTNSAPLRRSLTDTKKPYQYYCF